MNIGKIFAKFEETFNFRTRNLKLKLYGNPFQCNVEELPTNFWFKLIDFYLFIYFFLFYLYIYPPDS